jgi:hypothetical protein
LSLWGAIVCKLLSIIYIFESILEKVCNVT